MVALFVIIVDMKYINNLWVKVIASIVIGFLLASAGTKITYTCTPADGAAGCTSFEKAIMHPSDLLNNKQNSLTHFSKTFAITSLASFALLSILGFVQKKPKSTARSKD